MKKLRLIVFDWDGTLADSVDSIIQCKQYLAQQYNLPEPSHLLIKEVLGTEFSQAMARCFPTVEKNLLDQLGQEFKQRMQEAPQARLFPGAMDVLNALKKKGIKLAVATSKSRMELTKALAYTQLENFFDDTCCAEEYQPKPDPAMLNHLLERYAVNAHECLMLGDTTSDIDFATQAQVPVICVTFGAHSQAHLRQKNPFAFIDQWDQLLSILENQINALPSQSEIMENNLFSQDLEEYDDKQNSNKNPTVLNIS